jgi:hypothetical protein
VARLFEVNLTATGKTRSEAVEKLRAVIAETYRELGAGSKGLAERAGGAAALVGIRKSRKRK